MGKLLPLVLALAGLAAGAGAGLVLKPQDPEAEAAAEEPVAVDPAAIPEYAKLSNQFVVPIVEDGRITSMVVLSLSIEVVQGMTEKVYAMEPKLRDGMLQALFDHANTGGFKGSFTDAANLVLLRGALLEVARKILNNDVTDVLITDIVRQDV